MSGPEDRFGELSDTIVTFEPMTARLSVGVFRLENLVVGRSGSLFEAHEKQVFSDIRSTMRPDDVKDDQLFRSYRDLYWAHGMDPTKLRVSSEALIRRILSGLNLWRVSDVVDVVNLVSVHHRLPIGLIDEDHLDGSLVVRSAVRGEVFRRIGGAQLTCRGRELVVADAAKIVCFGFATHDSDQTKVTDNSRTVLVLLYGSPAVSAPKMKSAIEETSEAAEAWLHCRVGPFRVFRS